MTNITTIIFDFYGVVRGDGLLAWLTEIGLADDKEIQHIDDERCAGRLTREEYLTHLSRLTKYDSDFILERISQAPKLNSPVVNIIAKLHERYQTALLSNSTQSTLPYIEQHGIDKLFDRMFLSHELGMIKPQPEIYQYALSRLGVKPEATVFIDDKAANTAAARGLGMYAIDFKSPSQLTSELAKLGVKC
ncbi:MAG: HAD family phosphatase [Candidatus Nomurabacteria bacterium]|jgi:epoxide hydrolase-like predicted phosphatase|nr:HAD family phosphatase [Candidatus Nomurabacteria bacterium]